MAALGILCAAANVVQERSILNCLNEKFVGKPRVLESNARAFRAGLAAVRGERK